VRARAPRPAPPEALYVHVPFCISLCPYCDFVVVAGAAARGPESRISAYLAAVRRELLLRADLLDERWGLPAGGRRLRLGSLYLGGGTPSLLPAGAVAEIVALVDERYGLAPDAEITLEANPGPDDRGDAAALVAAGITRLSYGVQALDDTTLKRLGRRHRASDVAEAVTEARAAGVPSLSLDLLYDVPGGTVDGWMTTLDRALELEPDHLSLYALTLDDPDAEGLTGPLGDHLSTTRGARRWRDGARAGQDEDRAVGMYHHAVHRLAAVGFEGYEISNWARPGHESRHNLAYWERRPYEAVGPGAHAFDGATRRWTAARLDAYLAALAPDGARPASLPPGGEEVLDAATAAAERVILGLRTSRGIPAAAMHEPPLAAHAGWALAAELVDVTPDERIVLTTRGRLLSNELFARLV
jgi:oxygen-independent coproporphyrinogen-3 oxidase